MVGRHPREVSRVGWETTQNKALGIQTHKMSNQSVPYDLVPFDSLFELLTRGKEKSKQLGGEVLVSITSPLAGKIGPIQFFKAGRQTDTSANYWALPTKGSWIVGIGEAAKIITEGRLRFKQTATLLQAICRSAIIEGNGGLGPIFLGGFRFSSDTPWDATWKEFRDGLLTLPKWMISCTPNDRRSLTINLVLNGASDIVSLRKQLVAQSQILFNQDSTTAHSTSSPSARVESAADGWEENVRRVLVAIRDRKLSKVTLARALRLRAETAVSPEAVLESLTANYPECRIFAFCRGGTSFVGASPEELVSVDGTVVTSTCLAGSAPRGDSQATDTEFSSWLLSNEKERREHKVVVDWISERMSPLCTNLHWNDAPYVLRLGNVQHLATRFEGNRLNESHVLDFVEALHPTPAVGGMPLAPALEMIQKLENFDRGWYTGPVGWVDGNGNGEFAIAIRCALLRGREAVLYAGDGIVAGSDPKTEDHETTMKFKPLLTALGAL